MAEPVVSPALQQGCSIIVDEVKYLCSISDKLDLAQYRLMSMRVSLRELSDKMMRGDPMNRDLISKVQEVDQEVENIIETANSARRQREQMNCIKRVISKCACFPVYLIHLHKIGARIDAATARMNAVFDAFERQKRVAPTIPKEPDLITEDPAIQHWRLADPNLSKKVVVIGFDDQIKEIKDDLLDIQNMYLSVFSIVGPGGAGKSTMASKVYGLGAVKTHFEVQAWITVSQRFVVHDLLMEMVKRVIGLSKDEELELEEKKEDEVKKKIYDFLQTRRYLIVLDDVWSVDHWDMISGAFPDNKNGSRVILTTRNENVAKQPYARKKIYTPKLLNEEESTELLLSVALPEFISDSWNNNDPAVMGQNLDDLKKVGKDLAIKCRGLPLALLVLGGHLSRHLDINEWRRLTNSSEWNELITKDRIIGGILDLSFKDMPSDYLRCCFMYTTAFPEDQSINVQVLCNLWAEEGFIPLVRGRTHDEVAIGYVNELVQRCMVQVEKQTRCGRIVLIKLHDVLRDWGIGRARKAGVIRDCHNAKDVEADYHEEMKSDRVALHVILERKVEKSTIRPYTVLDFMVSSSYARNISNITRMFNILRHLHVLYLNSSRHGSENKSIAVPKEIVQLRYLRYLGLGGRGSYVLPRSIGNLQSLETLDASNGILWDIPDEWWEIPTLRHVHVSWVTVLIIPRISSQSEMHMTLYFAGPYPSPNDGFKEYINDIKQELSEERKPNLSYCLGLKFHRGNVNQVEIAGRCKGENKFRNHLTSLDSVTAIHVLKICCSSVLNNERKLLEFLWMESLRVLEIGEISYSGSVITCPRGSLPSLVLLVLHDLAVKDWKIEGGAMVNLVELTFCRCHNLGYLPEGLLSLQHLKKVQLIAMPAECYQEGTVARELKNKGCEVSVSSNEKDFKHLDFPILNDEWMRK